MRILKCRTLEQLCFLIHWGNNYIFKTGKFHWCNRVIDCNWGRELFKKNHNYPRECLSILCSPQTVSFVTCYPLFCRWFFFVSSWWAYHTLDFLDAYLCFKFKLLYNTIFLGIPTLKLNTYLKILSYIVLRLIVIRTGSLGVWKWSVNIVWSHLNQVGIM